MTCNAPLNYPTEPLRGALEYAKTISAQLTHQHTDSVAAAKLAQAVEQALEHLADYMKGSEL
jgi:hypothetical protein